MERELLKTKGVHLILETLRAYLHGSGGPQIGEVTCGGSPHLLCKRDQITNERLHGQTGYPT